ncbi:hypothetical protein V2I01_22560 [Micromonospora sp. BRA006-A]|nr:hypothetical protein [Micromonospora sp. BRA006-A]
MLPEGLAVTPSGTMYVTSSATGAVYRGDTRRPGCARSSPRRGRPDQRRRGPGGPPGRVLVAGWTTGTLFVYAPDGALLARRTAAPGAALNDLAVTGDAVYVTDSATGTLWRAAVDDGHVGTLVPWVGPDDFPAARSSSTASWPTRRAGSRWSRNRAANACSGSTWPAGR